MKYYPDPQIEELHLRAELADVRDCRLDGLRASVPKWRTSTIVFYMAQPVAIAALFEVEVSKGIESLLAAAMLILGDELNRRIPVPGVTQRDPVPA